MKTNDQFQGLRRNATRGRTFVLVFFFLASGFSPPQSDASGNDTVSTEPLSWEAGVIDATEVRRTTLRLVSTSLRATILRARTNCNCLKAKVTNPTVTPESPGEVVVELTVAGFGFEGVGAVTKNVFVHWADDVEHIENFPVRFEVRGRSERQPPEARLTGDKPVVRELGASVVVHLFGAMGCPTCDNVFSWIRDHLAEHFGSSVEIAVHDTSEPEQYLLLVQCERALQQSSNASVVAVVGRNYMAGPSEIKEAFHGAIADALTNPQPSGFPPQPTGRERCDSDAGSKELLAERFATFTVPVVFLAGLADGINPCAFATMVLFLSYLTLRGHGQRRATLLLGLAFTGGVFLTYMVGGLFAMGALRSFLWASGLSKAFCICIAALSIMLAVLSIRDLLKYARTRNSEGMLLRLPWSVRQRVGSAIRSSFRQGAFVATAFVAGVVVSVLESVCTGQLYLPTIALILKQEGFRSQAVLLLFLYNAAFVLPLVALVALSLFGVSGLRMQEFARKHLVAAKAAMSAVFAALGVFLFLTTF